MQYNIVHIIHTKMKITWFLCAILIALALYVFYLNSYTSQIETMTDLESILKQMKEHKKRKKKT